MTHAELAAALDRCTLVQARAAAAAIRAGWEVKPMQIEGTFEQLAHTYAVRSHHLEHKVTPHAEQLAVSTEEFAANLRSHEAESIGTWYTVSSGVEHEYLVFCSELGEPLGCLRTVSQLRVSKQRWRELWGEA